MITLILLLAALAFMSIIAILIVLAGTARDRQDYIIRISQYKNAADHWRESASESQKEALAAIKELEIAQTRIEELTKANLHIVQKYVQATNLIAFYNMVERALKGA
ncbi:MAG: hypothetical protein PHC50_03465 [Candidatus Cloacimonetes bacterium]|nr:hypothetical protein [Candidatus Cloacimonadota bacterium]